MNLSDGCIYKITKYMHRAINQLKVEAILSW